MLLLNDRTFDKHLQSHARMLVMFKAPFAGPCLLAEEMLKGAKEHIPSSIKVTLFDIQDNPKVPDFYGVKQLPLFMLFENGKPIDLVAGAIPEDFLLNWLEDR